MLLRTLKVCENQMVRGCTQISVLLQNWLFTLNFLFVIKSKIVRKVTVCERHNDNVKPAFHLKCKKHLKAFTNLSSPVSSITNIGSKHYRGCSLVDIRIKSNQHFLSLSFSINCVAAYRDNPFSSARLSEELLQRRQVITETGLEEN